jgi:aldehyde:ferredoxin oxidoreductase
VNKNGYAGEILKVDLSAGKTFRIPTSDYSERFLGGRGLAAKLYWDMVPVEAKALDPENCLIFVTGPMAGLVIRRPFPAAIWAEGGERL